jgi:hypothetical protein
MAAPNSRYATVGEAKFTSPEGHTALYLLRRLLPDPESVRGNPVTVRPGERIDLVAARTLGSPAAFYRLCDASAIADPFVVAEGRAVQVYQPVAPGIPGVGT